MIIERTDNEIVIKLKTTVDLDELQDLASYFRDKEIASTYTTSQSVVNEFSSELNKNWHKENRDRLIK